MINDDRFQESNVFSPLCRACLKKNTHTAYQLPAKTDAFCWTFHMFERRLGQGDLEAIAKNDAMTRLALLSQFYLELIALRDITKRPVSIVIQIL